MDQPSRPSDHEVQAYAASVVGHDAFKEIIRRIKNDILYAWANEGNSAARDELWFKMQGVGAFEHAVRGLAEAKMLDRRKQEQAKARAARRVGG